MTTITRSSLVAYDAAKMYALVNDIESYPEFLPWCSGSRILQRSEQEVSAQLDISKGSIKQSFSTLNRLTQDQQIEMSLIDGPFQYLQGVWTFETLSDEGCKVSLKLDFKFKNKMMEMLMGKAFSHIASNMVDAFVNRAKKIYE